MLNYFSAIEEIQDLSLWEEVISLYMLQLSFLGMAHVTFTHLHLQPHLMMIAISEM